MTKRTNHFIGKSLFGICVFMFLAVYSSGQYSNWSYRTVVDITENSGSTLNNIQAMIRVNTAGLIAQGKMNPDGSDMRFALDCEGLNPVAYYIERWMNTDTTEVWVRVPTLPANTTIEIWMFYGNTSATSQSNFGAVFPNSYILPPAGIDVLGGNLNYDWFEVQSGATVYLFQGLPLSIEARRIKFNGIIDGNGTGYDGGPPVTAGGGPGAGGAGGGTGAGGGGYGSTGGDGGYDIASPANGGVVNGATNSFAIDMGSGGGGAVAFGGNGGGAVAFTGKVVELGGFFDLQGWDGECCDNGSGGGAGGGLFMAGDYSVYSAIASVDGGSGGNGGFGDNDGGGGGSGGRAKFFSDTQGLITGFVSAFGGAGGWGGGGPNENGLPGLDGTTFVGTYTSPEPSTTVWTEQQIAKADFTSTAPKCQGDTLSFSNTGSTGGGWTYEWNFGTGASPATSTNENPAGISYSSSGTKNVMFIVSDGICPDTVWQNINIMETPNAGFTTTAPVCEGQSVDFTNTGSTGAGITFSWDFGAGAFPATSTSENPVSIYYLTGGSKTITQTVTKGSCSATITSTITINNSPTASFSSTAPECTGVGVDFTNTGSTGGGWTFEWNLGAGATPATSVVENPTGVTYSTAGTKTVMFIITDGTCPDTIWQTIDINLTPTADFTSTAPVCAGQTVDFTNIGSTGGQWSYSWDLGAGASPAVSTAENPTSVIYNAGGTKTITFTITDGTCTDVFSNSITIDSLPVADAGLDTVICADRSVQIGSAPVGGSTYSWFPASTLDDPSISNPTASPIALLTIYTVMVVDGNGCQNTDSVRVTMLDPLVPYAGVDVEICRGDSIQIGTGFLEGQLYSWTPNVWLDYDTISNPIAKPDSTTTYVLLVSGGGCDTVSDEVTVTVHQLPIANAGVDTSITTGASVQLVATGGVQYVWSPPSGLDNSGVYNPFASPGVSTTYTVTVTDIYGCASTDTVLVTVDSASFWNPTAFTPNGDNLNDVFYIRGEGVTDFEFIVFDRWGATVFYTRDLNQGWDGNNQPSGEKMPEGAYVFHIRGTKSDNSTFNKSGIINLIR